MGDYRVEIRPCNGWWRQWEGRVVQLMGYKSGPSLERDPTSGKQVWPEVSGPYAPKPMRRRSRERLERTLQRALDRILADVAQRESAWQDATAKGDS